METLTANKITAHNAGWRSQFRFAVSVFWSGVCEFWRSTMKTILIFLFALLILESRGFAGLDTDIPQTNQVVLSSGRWKPSAEETQKALAAIQTFLEKPSSTNDSTKREIQKIQEHAKEYRVQFVGVVRDGKRMIWCNFFPAAETFGADWKREKVRVMDGGFWFWQIEYDPSAGKCLNFSSNGYA